MFTGLVPAASSRQPVRGPFARGGGRSAKHRGRIQGGGTPHGRESVHSRHGFLPAEGELLVLLG